MYNINPYITTPAMTERDQQLEEVTGVVRAADINVERRHALAGLPDATRNYKKRGWNGYQ